MACKNWFVGCHYELIVLIKVLLNLELLRPSSLFLIYIRHTGCIHWLVESRILLLFLFIVTLKHLLLLERNGRQFCLGLVRRRLIGGILIPLQSWNALSLDLGLLQLFRIGITQEGGNIVVLWLSRLGHWHVVVWRCPLRVEQDVARGSGTIERLCVPLVRAH